MDQFDRAIENVFNASTANEPSLIGVVGGNQTTVDSLRANLEIAGHQLVCFNNNDEYETYLTDHHVDMVIVSCENQEQCEEVFETTSLLSESTVVSGFSTNPSYESAIQFIRMGGADFYSLPADLSVVSSRIDTILNQTRQNLDAKENATQIAELCNEINDERHRVEDEMDSMSSNLANSHCETEKKMRQVAMGAEFQTLISQELDVESMLRTALGYMLTRIGAVNAAVYLREGDVDWGVGAFVNYDRQVEDFQELLSGLCSAVCPAMSGETKLKKYTDGEVFAEFLELEAEDYTGNEVVTCGCYHNDKCMAVMVLFRSDTKPFSEETIEAIDIMRHIFGQQLSTILKIHKRGEITWPSESVDDDDWSFGKAA